MSIINVQNLNKTTLIAYNETKYRHPFSDRFSLWVLLGRTIYSQFTSSPLTGSFLPSAARGGGGGSIQKIKLLLFGWSIVNWKLIPNNQFVHSIIFRWPLLSTFLRPFISRFGQQPSPHYPVVLDLIYWTKRRGWNGFNFSIRFHCDFLSISANKLIDKAPNLLYQELIRWRSSDGHDSREKVALRVRHLSVQSVFQNRELIWWVMWRPQIARQFWWSRREA